MDTRINIVQGIDPNSKDIVRILTIFILAGLIDPKFKYLHWKLIKLKGLSTYLDIWIYSMSVAENPQLAVVALCKGNRWKDYGRN